MPRWHWLEIVDEERLAVVIDGIKRYHAAGVEIPEQWFDEYFLITHAMERRCFS
jgi:phage gp29-like protein